MRITQPALLLSVLLCAACGSRNTAPTRLAAVKSDVQSFARSVAEDVTNRGPVAWQHHFEDSPSFFMAVDGLLQFSDGAAAQSGIHDLVRAIKKVELHWGDDLRVDPLTEDLAVLATPWRETLILADGNRRDATGYFTAVAENRNGHWQFRNAHWSTTQAAK